MSDIDRMKRFIRNLKREEERMICGILHIDEVACPLIWNQFFDLKKPYKSKAKYNIDRLLEMGESEFEEVINEYFSSIVEYFFKQNACSLYPIFNLPENSDIYTVKKRFRELAKTMHPDTGGSHEEFLALYEVYDEFMKNKRSKHD